jgi:Arc/MetJ family transcription regulator
VNPRRRTQRAPAVWGFASSPCRSGGVPETIPADFDQRETIERDIAGQAAGARAARIYWQTYNVYHSMMKTVVDLDEDLLDRARRELGTTTKKDTIHEALRLVAERGARLQAVQELLSVDRDWTDIVDEDKTPTTDRGAA